MDEEVDGPCISRYIIENIKQSNEHFLQITDAFSYKCNLKCVYCMQQNIHEKDKRIAPEVRVNEWIKLMKLHNADELSVCLFGGEPLFNVNYLTAILKSAKEKIGNVSYSIVTNGTLIDSRVIKLINGYHINRIQITLDGPEKVHNARRVANNMNCYETIIANMHKVLAQTDSSIILNTVIDTANFDQIDKMINILMDELHNYIFSKQPRIIFNYGMECHPFGKSKYTQEHIQGILY